MEKLKRIIESKEKERDFTPDDMMFFFSKLATPKQMFSIQIIGKAILELSEKLDRLEELITTKWEK